MLVLDGCRGVVLVVSHILYGFKLVVDRVDGSLKLGRLQHSQETVKPWYPRVSGRALQFVFRFVGGCRQIAFFVPRGVLPFGKHQSFRNGQTAKRARIAGRRAARSSAACRAGRAYQYAYL